MTEDAAAGSTLRFQPPGTSPVLDWMYVGAVVLFGLLLCVLGISILAWGTDPATRMPRLGISAVIVLISFFITYATIRSRLRASVAMAGDELVLGRGWFRTGVPLRNLHLIVVDEREGVTLLKLVTQRRVYRLQMADVAEDCAAWLHEQCPWAIYVTATKSMFLPEKTEEACMALARLAVYYTRSGWRFVIGLGVFVTAMVVLIVYGWHAHADILREKPVEDVLFDVGLVLLFFVVPVFFQAMKDLFQARAIRRQLREIESLNAAS